MLISFLRRRATPPPPAPVPLLHSTIITCSYRMRVLFCFDLFFIFLNSKDTQKHTHTSTFGGKSHSVKKGEKKSYFSRTLNLYLLCISC